MTKNGATKKPSRRANTKAPCGTAELERVILQTSERERQRIGCDLHNDLVQRLVGISYMSHLLTNALASSGAPEAQQAAKITSLLNDALGATHALTRGLYPVAIETSGLMVALADLAELTSAMFRIDCQFISPAEAPSLNSDVAAHLYRIAQEAVTNAVSHGKADKITIELKARGQNVAISVADNGTGLPELNTERKGMGLRIMKYRANVVGGSLVITNPAEGGTTVSCEVSAAT